MLGNNDTIYIFLIIFKSHTTFSPTREKVLPVTIIIIILQVICYILMVTFSNILLSWKVSGVRLLSPIITHLIKNSVFKYIFLIIEG